MENLRAKFRQGNNEQDLDRRFKNKKMREEDFERFDWGVKAWHFISSLVRFGDFWKIITGDEKQKVGHG